MNQAQRAEMRGRMNSIAGSICGLRRATPTEDVKGMIASLEEQYKSLDHQYQDDLEIERRSGIVMGVLGISK